MNDPQYLRASDASIPPQYKVANESERPMFLQVDFGLVRNGSGELEPKLVELQAFPSVYEYQPLAARQYIESYGLPEDLGIYLSGYNRDSYWKLLHDAIVDKNDPKNVILMEIDPDHQKTRPDFLVTQRELGISIVDILSLIKRGRKLFYREEGREIEVQRIYNRCIVDELERRNVNLPFDLRDDLDVEEEDASCACRRWSNDHLRVDDVGIGEQAARRLDLHAREIARPTLKPSHSISGTTIFFKSEFISSQSSRHRTGRRRWRSA